MSTTIDGGFQGAIASILVIAQCFGIMPVVGITCKSASNLTFQLRSIRTVYAFVTCILSFIYAALSVAVMCSRRIQFDRISRLTCIHYAEHILTYFHLEPFSSIVNMVFYGSTFYGMFCFGVLAKKWPKIMVRWEEIEATLPKYRTNVDKMRLARHIKWLTIVVFLTSLGECLKHVCLQTLMNFLLFEFILQLSMC